MTGAAQSDGAHAALQPRAITSAHRILAATMEHGPVGPLDMNPDSMPTPELRQIAGTIRNAWNAGRRGWTEVLGFALEGIKSQADQDHAKAVILEISESPYERPEVMTDAARIVADYHEAERMQRLTWRLQSALHTGGDTAAIIREMTSTASVGSVYSQAFTITLAGDLDGSTEPADFVEGLLTEGGASLLYGPSNCGKSFWILDLAVSVATGKPFRDELEVDRGAVIYVALEGSHGVKNRIKALRLSGKLPDSTPLFLCFSPVSLREPGHAVRLAESVKQAAEQSNLPCRLVILDTLARAMAGGDENSGQDMTAAVASIDAVRAATGAHVCVVHHCGKDADRGARGHSSLRAAVDTEIEVFKPEGESISTVRVTKQRDLPAGDAMPFSLKSVELGISRRGKLVTSCVVRHEDEMMAAQKGKAGRPPAASDDEILALLPAPSTAAWQKSADEELGVSKSAFHRSLKKLRVHAANQINGGTWVRK